MIGNCLEDERLIWSEWTVIFKKIRFTDEQRCFLLNLLHDHEVWGSLYFGVRVNLKQEEIDLLVVGILDEDKFPTWKIIDALSAGIEIGVREYDWQCPAVPQTQKVSRNISAFNVFDNAFICKAEKLERFICENANFAVKTASGSARRGMYYCSLIFRSGVIWYPLLLDVCKHMDKPLVRARSLSYVVLNSPQLNQTRLIISEACELIYLSMSDLDIAEAKSSKRRIYKDIKCFFVEFELEDILIPSSLPDLFKLCGMLAVRRYPRDLTDYSMGKIKTTQLRDKSFSRLMRVEWVGQKEKEPSSCSDNGEIFEKDLTPGSALQDLAHSIDVELKEEALSKVDKLKNKYYEKRDSENNIYVLINWIGDCVIKSDFNWERTRQESLLLVYGIVRVVYGSLGSGELISLSKNEYMVFYQSVIDLSTSFYEQKKIARQLYLLHQYLEERFSAPKIPISKSFFAQYLSNNVDANLVTFEEFNEAISLTSKEANVVEASIVADITTIGFKTGARTSEARELLSGNFESSLLELYIREHDGHRLKTSNAKRNIPFKALVGHEGCIAFKRRKEVVEKERVTSEGVLQFMFGDKGDDFSAAPERKRISKLLHAILRKATNDGGARYYTLRHSAFSWLMLSLMWPPGFSSKWLELDAYSQDFMESSDSILRAFQGLGDLPDVKPQFRQIIYYLFRNHGHSSALTSYEHYMHFFDLLWFAYLKKYYGEMSNDALAKLTGYTERTIREARSENCINYLLDKYRKSKPNRITILPLINKGGDKNTSNEKKLTNLVAWFDICLRIIELNTAHNIDAESLSQRFDLPLFVIASVLKRYKEFNNCNFSKVNNLYVRKHDEEGGDCGLLKSPRIIADITIHEESLKKLIDKLEENFESTIEEIEYLVMMGKWRKYGVQFTESNKATEYLNWLKKLGFNITQLKITHLHGKATKKDISLQRKLWREELDLPKKCAVSSACHSKTSPMKPKGFLNVSVAGKSSSIKGEKLTTSYAFPLTLLTVFLFAPIYKAHEVDIQI